MELELESVRRWFSRLRLMQRCASNISNDTPDDLADFYKAKHAAILTSAAQTSNFAFCVFQNSNISVREEDFAATSSFHELLDECHRNLRIAVRGLFRAVAIDVGSVPPAQDPVAFEALKTKDVYDTDARIDALSEALASVMPIFPQLPAQQAAFRALLKNNATTLKAAIDVTVKE